MRRVVSRKWLVGIPLVLTECTLPPMTADWAAGGIMGSGLPGVHVAGASGSGGNVSSASHATSGAGGFSATSRDAMVGGDSASSGSAGAAGSSHVLGAVWAGAGGLENGGRDSRSFSSGGKLSASSGGSSSGSGGSETIETGGTLSFAGNRSASSTSTGAGGWSSTVGAAAGVVGSGGTSSRGGTSVGGAAPSAGGTTVAGGVANLAGSAGSGVAGATGGLPGGGGVASAGAPVFAGCPGTGGPAMVRLPLGYCIDGTEVTRAQYAAWLSTTPADPTSIQDSLSCGWNTSFVPAGDWGSTAANPNEPVVFIDWCDAYAYCAGVGKRLCGKIGGGMNVYNSWADVTQSQWYAACTSNGAFGATGFPYGDTYSARTCNGAETGYDGKVEVKFMSNCQSTVPGFAGIYDLSGNVGEWEDSCSGSARGADAICHVRGGTFYRSADELSCGFNVASSRNTFTDNIGFRCCAP